MTFQNEFSPDSDHWEKLFEESPIGIALVGIDHSWLRVNKKLCEITGYSRNELAGKTFDDITHPEDLKGDVETLKQLQLGEVSSYSMIKRYISKNGRVKWVSLHVQPVKDDNEQIIHYVSHIVPLEGNGVKTQKVESEEGHKYEIRPSITWLEFCKDNYKFVITLLGLVGSSIAWFCRWLVTMHDQNIHRAVEEAMKKVGGE